MQKAPSRDNGALRPFPTDLHIPPMAWRSDLLTTSAPQGRACPWIHWPFPVNRKQTKETFHKPGSPLHRQIILCSFLCNPCMEAVLRPSEQSWVNQKNLHSRQTCSCLVTVRSPHSARFASCLPPPAFQDRISFPASNFSVLVSAPSCPQALDSSEEPSDGKWQLSSSRTAPGFQPSLDDEGQGLVSGEKLSSGLGTLPLSCFGKE